MEEKTIKSLSRQNSQSRAFTLIELLVVIAIIIILAAILFPVFASAKMAAFKTVDLSNVKQIALGQALYIDDSDDRYMFFPQEAPTTQNGELGPFWTDRQANYVKSQEIYSAPVNKDPVYGFNGYFTPGTNTYGLIPKYRVTYAMNPALSKAWSNPAFGSAAQTSSVEDPANVTTIGPSLNSWTFMTCIEQPAGSGIMHYAWMFSESEAGWGFELFGNKNERGGFDGGVNFSYMDLHAKFSRTVNEGTHPGDLYPYKGRDLFRGRFTNAIARERVSTNGTCPASRAANSY